MNGGRRGVIASLARWETLLAIVLIVLIGIGASLSPVFLTPRNFANLIAAVIEVAIMSLPMALIIISGEIDLSVESMVGLSAAVLGTLYAAGVPIELVIPIVLVVGALGGLLNGVLVTRMGLPSLVVTVGTLALYRGLALVVLGSRGVSAFPDWFTTFGFGTTPGIPIPWPFILYLALAVVLGGLLHRTWVGRQIYAIGKNSSAVSLLRRPGRPHQAGPVRPVRNRRRPCRDHPDRAAGQRTRRRRHGPDARRRHDRAPRAASTSSAGAGRSLASSSPSSPSRCWATPSAWPTCRPTSRASSSACC